jgi:regulation of enolase protein 1 (concanavalin A-like superfamily)
MVRFSSDCWLKASNEFEPEGPSHLGTVVTNFGFSDWSLQDFPYGETRSYSLRVRREGLDLLVEHAATETGPWNLMRIARLHSASEPVAQMGLYACSPKEGGCLVDAGFLRIEIS